MEKPKYNHFCSNCKFLGHYNNLDVYYCLGDVLARYGNDDPDYASCNLNLFKSLIESNSNILIKNIITIPFQEYLFSEYVTDYHKAWMIALTIKGNLK